MVANQACLEMTGEKQGGYIAESHYTLGCSPKLFIGYVRQDAQGTVAAPGAENTPYLWVLDKLVKT